MNHESHRTYNWQKKEFPTENGRYLPSRCVNQFANTLAFFKCSFPVGVTFFMLLFSALQPQKLFFQALQSFFSSCGSHIGLQYQEPGVLLSILEPFWLCYNMWGVSSRCVRLHQGSCSRVGCTENLIIALPVRGLPRRRRDMPLNYDDTLHGIVKWWWWW